MLCWKDYEHRLKAVYIQDVSPAPLGWAGGRKEQQKKILFFLESSVSKNHMCVEKNNALISSYV